MPTSMLNLAHLGLQEASRQLSAHLCCGRQLKWGKGQVQQIHQLCLSWNNAKIV